MNKFLKIASITVFISIISIVCFHNFVVRPSKDDYNHEECVNYSSIKDNLFDTSWVAYASAGFLYNYHIKIKNYISTLESLVRKSERIKKTMDSCALVKQIEQEIRNSKELILKDKILLNVIIKEYEKKITETVIPGLPLKLK